MNITAQVTVCRETLIHTQTTICHADGINYNLALNYAACFIATSSFQTFLPDCARILATKIFCAV